MTPPPLPDHGAPDPSDTGPPADWRVETARSGDLTAFQNGRALHSRFDPRKEADRTARSVPDDAAIVVLGGLGLGYVAEALLRDAPDRRLIIAEADPDLPSRANACRGMKTILENPGVTLIAGGPPGDIRELLRGGPAGAAIHYLEWKPSAALNPIWYAELREAVEETSRRRDVNARTLERFGPLWVRNLAANATMMSAAVSLDPWKDAFAGIPALILAGGPSLEDILPHLRSIADRHLIITVDTALSALLRYGVKPDIIAAVDPQYWNARHLDRCGEGAGDALVLSESATHPAVFRTLKGRPWLTRTRFPLGTLLEDAAGIEGELKAGGSVATAAWDLARHLGCSPLCIAGLDLGFPGGRTHYSGSLSRERPLKYSRRNSPAENTFFHALRDAGARPVASTGGGSVLSDARMDVYAAWFTESAVQIPDRSPAIVGTAGRAIPGMASIGIPELERRPIIRNRIVSLLDEIRGTPVQPGSAERIRATVSSVLKALEDLESSADRGAVLAEKAAQEYSSGRDGSRLIGEMEEVDRRILGGSGRDVISFLIQPIIMEITSGRSAEGRNPMEISRRLYGEMAKSASYHRKCLERINFD